MYRYMYTAPFIYRAMVSLMYMASKLFRGMTPFMFTKVYGAIRRLFCLNIYGVVNVLIYDVIYAKDIWRHKFVNVWRH